MSPHSQACGTCGVSNQRILCEPSESSSPSASPRGARFAKSPTDVRRRREKLVERAALVGLEVRESDVPELLDRHHGADRLAHEREEAAEPGVEHHRRLVDDQVLIEVESHVAG
jgi:hypothetical protein